MNATGTNILLRKLRLSTFVECHIEVAEKAEKQGWSFNQFLQHLAELELVDRQRRRRERYLKRSRLPAEKTVATLNLNRFSVKVRRQIPTLCEGHFAQRGENVLLFGKPGRGKTHLVAAIGYELIKRDFEVLFTPTFKLVQRLLVAKKELELEKELKRLDRFDVVILDDIGYVQQERNEMEVLFTFLGERYERKSVMITSNLGFSKWDKIFKDPMTTAAAIDRLVHHATILECYNKTSYRNNEAKERNSR